MDKQNLAKLASSVSTEIKVFLKIFLAVAIVAGVLGLAVFTLTMGDDTDTQPEAVETVDSNGLPGDVYKFHDNETNATCYVYESRNKGAGISCITPDANTTG